MSIRIYSVPQGETITNDFLVSANGQAVPVHTAWVSAVPFNRRWPGHQRSADQGELAYFAAFEKDGPVEVQITPKKQFQSVIVRPLSKSITPRIEGNTIAFNVADAGGYTVELDGFHNALHLFVDPNKTYDVDLADENTLYFGPGIHDAGLINLKSGQTVYLDAGAVVYACIHAKDVDNIRILGRGILDNSKNVEEILFAMDKLGDGSRDVKNCRRQHTIRLQGVKNIEIDGITIRNSLVYNIAAYGCEGLTVNNVKIIGCWRYNTDGIDLHNCSHCVIRNCFVRTFDDSICVKGHTGYPQVCEDILVENCTVWCDWGMALEIGAETRAEQIHAITFRNCDIIRSTGAVLDIQNVDYGDVYDVRFEDIRVEYDAVSQYTRIQKDDEDVFVADPHSDHMPLLIHFSIPKHSEYSGSDNRRGKNHDITLCGIKVFAERMPPSSLAGYDNEHTTADIKIMDLTRNGKKLMTLNDAKIQLGNFTENITIA